MSSEPWLIHFFQRHPADDPGRAVPAQDFLDGLPTKVLAEMVAVLDAVAEAPPPAFSGGGMNHRLFCILERDAADLGGSSIVVIDGLSKPKRSAAKPKDYRRVLRMKAEFSRRRTVLE